MTTLLRDVIRQTPPDLDVAFILNPRLTVRELLETGAHDVLVVRGEDGRDRLIPTARELMREVDLEQGRIVVVDLPGLLDPV